MGSPGLWHKWDKIKFVPNIIILKKKKVRKHLSLGLLDIITLGVLYPNPPATCSNLR